MDTAYVLALDTTDAEELVVEAQELLEKARTFCLHSQNCIAGNELQLNHRIYWKKQRNA